jgi:hypothetical protein
MKKYIITILSIAVLLGILIWANKKVFYREPEKPIVETEKPLVVDEQGRVLSTPENASRGPASNPEKNIISF